MPIEHDIIPLGEIHIVHNWEYADAAARTGATGFIASDVGKWAKQLDNGTFWELTATTPTWAQRTGTGIGGSTGSTDNALLRADGTGGNTAQASAITVDDNGAITVPEIAAPSTPASGKVVLYAKADGLLYSKDDAGTETVVTGGGGGGISGLTTNKIPVATSSTTLGDSGFTQTGGVVTLASNDLTINQSLKSGGATPSVYISGNVSNAGGIALKNNQEIGWTSGSDASAAAIDIGLERKAAGQLAINDGTVTSAGSDADLRDLMLRQLYMYQTITAGGTTGDQTINKAAGTVNIAAAGTAVTVTNSLVSTSSIVLAVIRTNDSTAWIKNVVPGSGSFTINLGAAATAEISIGFVVINK